MANISYDLILNSNLKKKPLYLEQIEAVLEIGGAKPDPLTLQQIRDETSINQCFKARRKTINDLITDYGEQMKKARSEKEAEGLLKDFNDELKKETTTLARELQTRVDNFARKQKKEANDLFWARAKLVFKVAYSAGKLIKGGLEAVGKAAAAVSGPGIFISVVALKSLVSTGMDLKGAYDDIISAMEGERAQYAKLEAAVKKLKSLKAPKPVPQSDIDAVEGMLGPYGARLLGVDASAKAAATQLDKYLTALEKGKFRDPKAQDVAEKMVAHTIKQIIKLSKNIADGRKLVQSARSKIVEASKRAKADPTSWWDYAPNVWKLFDAVVDMREEAMDVSGLKATFDKCHGVFMDKIEGEMKDAFVEEKTRA